jgi:hypothetical protein
MCAVTCAEKVELTWAIFHALASSRALSLARAPPPPPPPSLISPLPTPHLSQEARDKVETLTIQNQILEAKVSSDNDLLETVAFRISHTRHTLTHTHARHTHIPHPHTSHSLSHTSHTSHTLTHTQTHARAHTHTNITYTQTHDTHVRAGALSLSLASTLSLANPLSRSRHCARFLSLHNR